MIETRLTDEMAEKAMSIGVSKFNKLAQKDVIPKYEGYISISVVDFVTGQATVLLEISIGDRSTWDYDYESLAKGKTMASVRNKMSMDRLLKHPELVLPGDVKYSGNTLRGNIDVSCSSSASGDVDKKITKKMAQAIVSFLKENFESQLLDETTHFFS